MSKKAYICFLLLGLTACSPYKSGSEVVEALAGVDYFTATDTTRVAAVSRAIATNYDVNRRFRSLPDDGRYLPVDCDRLFRNGGLTFYLDQAQTITQTKGLSLVYANDQLRRVTTQKGYEQFTHTIDIDGQTYTAFDGRLDSPLVPAVAFVNFGELLNNCLKRAGTNERFYLVGFGSDAALVMLSNEQYRILKRATPDDEYRLRLPRDWRNYFQLDYNY